MEDSPGGKDESIRNERPLRSQLKHSVIMTGCNTKRDCGD